jgi:hypothetical protein
MYSNPFKNHGTLSKFTKNPEKSINGIRITGVKVIAIYLSEKSVPIIKENPVPAL